MKSILMKIQILCFLCALPALANDVGLHNSSAQPTRAPLQTPLVLVAQSNQAQHTAQPERALGVCQVIKNLAGEPLSGDDALDPDAAAVNYLFEFEKKRGLDERSAKITFLELPKHGKVVNEVGNVSEIFKGGNYYSYIPDAGYYGKDKIVAQVEIDGYKVKVVYFMQLVKENVGDSFENKYCPNGQRIWKISL